ncbi:acyltransferase (plasmid) [Polymorphobacter megasporae]|nr:acyltransferase [Polymorphobacter megasporae]
MFTILRFVLASAVIFSHGFVLTGQANNDPTRTIFSYPFSTFAVILFFALSGLLVTGGLVRKGITVFIKARAFRLLPGLLVMLLTTVALGFGFSSDDLGHYLREPSIYKYLFRNALLIGKYYSVESVFNDVTLKNVVNGSLWTIRREVLCYGLLAVLRATGLLQNRTALLIVLVVGIIVDCSIPIEVAESYGPLRHLILAFFTGVIAYLYREKIYLSWPLAALFVVVALATKRGELGTQLVAFSFIYLMLVTSILVPDAIKKVSSRLPDYSYGLYIYGFPAQQAIIQSGLGVSPYPNMFFSIAISLMFAAISWHLVEHPALRWARR